MNFVHQQHYFPRRTLKSTNHDKKIKTSYKVVFQLKN